MFARRAVAHVDTLLSYRWRALACTHSHSRLRARTCPLIRCLSTRPRTDPRCATPFLRFHWHGPPLSRRCLRSRRLGLSLLDRIAVSYPSVCPCCVPQSSCPFLLFTAPPSCLFALSPSAVSLWSRRPRARIQPGGVRHRRDRACCPPHSCAVWCAYVHEVLRLLGGRASLVSRSATIHFALSRRDACSTCIEAECCLRAV